MNAINHKPIFLELSQLTTKHPLHKLQHNCAACRVTINPLMISTHRVNYLDHSLSRRLPLREASAPAY